jgi:hypothetical protein
VEDEKRRKAAADASEENELLSRRDFLQSLKKWSQIVIGSVALGGLVEGPEAEAGWVNSRGSWVNGHGGGGWANRGASWVNGGGGWLNGGGGGGWINRGGTWVNGGGGWVNRSGGGGWVNRGGGTGWVNRRGW